MEEQISTGKVRTGLAIIVGAAGGIGSAIAHYAAQNFHHCVLMDMHEANLASVMESIREKNPRATLSHAIVDIRDNVAFTRCLQGFGEKEDIELLVNSAGISIDGTSDIDFHDFQDMVQINLMGTVTAIQAVLPFMKKNNTGYIINIVSQSGKRARPVTGAYAASKFGVMGYTEGLQKELIDTNISFTSICPGMVDTSQTDEDTHIVEKKYMIQPADIVTTIDYLLSLPPNVSVKEIVMECKKQVAQAG